ncbi:MAG: T9SS type A sorting domain-containing protein [Saprospiraceae bacterium]|nr:T9SS type A sorting domain-containing protein [Saprospiraceae bacterium]
MYVQYESDKEKNTTLQIFDISGRLVRNIDRELNDGVNLLKIETFDLGTGLYVLKIGQDVLRFQKNVIFLLKILRG